jgi:hypothetical protein
MLTSSETATIIRTAPPPQLLYKIVNKKLLDK